MMGRGKWSTKDYEILARWFKLRREKEEGCFTAGPKELSIELIVTMVQTLCKACTSINIKDGFRKTGIYPLNVNIFTEQDFTPSYANDRPNTGPKSTVENEVGPTIIPENDRPEAGCSKDFVSTFSVLSPAETGVPMISAEDVGPLTPEDVRPLKKPESRKKIGKNSRLKKGTTDSPNLKALKEKKESLETKKLKYKKKRNERQQKTLAKDREIIKKTWFLPTKKR
ncbi:hypothetical protein AVEN_190313-1 [Araneus ventricosus]|uniref:HTH CENPB-type domain-containing protein n=1 Tax=Araneus ventricosus TaxID=182803 RepID=A0A4Y2UHT2_ARAVE|nr:hypothetical protein AVEN_190313-1 [Araneus ventricosus]